MKRARVLVVDDSAIARRMITEALSSDPDIEVASFVRSGRAALDRLQEASFDLVTLDIEMPEMNGLETLVEIRKHYPRLPVIMVSSLSEREARRTMEALARGATDYVTKPSGMNGPAEARAHLVAELVPRVRALCLGAQAAAPRVAPAARRAAPLRREAPERPRSRAAILAIGSSTGGPKALGTVLKGIGGCLPVPVVIVQHMPPLFTGMLAEQLSSAGIGMPVHEARHGAPLRPGEVSIAPGGRHMRIERKGQDACVVLGDDPPVHSCRPAVDPMLESVTRAYGPAVLAVILTGMGCDGMRGCELVREAGGEVFAQDKASSVVWGMPGHVVEAGLAHRVLSVEDMGPAIGDRLGRRAPGRGQDDGRLALGTAGV